MSVVTPAIIFGPTLAPGTEHRFPLTTVANTRLSRVTPQAVREGRPRALLEQSNTSIDANTPGGPRQVSLTIRHTGTNHTDLARAMARLWDAFGSEKNHLWIVDDASQNAAFVAGAVGKGSNVLVDYTNNLSGTDFLAGYGTGSIIWYAAGTNGDGNEFTIVEAHNPSGTELNADLVYDHGVVAVLLRVGIVFPNARLRQIRPISINAFGTGDLELLFDHESDSLTSALPS